MFGLRVDRHGHLGGRILAFISTLFGNIIDVDMGSSIILGVENQWQDYVRQYAYMHLLPLFFMASALNYLEYYHLVFRISNSNHISDVLF